MNPEEITAWVRDLDSLKEELRDREKSLPAHSIRPHQLLVIEELEEKIKALQEKIDRAKKNSQGPE